MIPDEKCPFLEKEEGEEREEKAGDSEAHERRQQRNGSKKAASRKKRIRKRKKPKQQPHQAETEQKAEQEDKREEGQGERGSAPRFPAGPLLFPELKERGDLPPMCKKRKAGSHSREGAKAKARARGAARPDPLSSVASVSSSAPPAKKRKAIFWSEKDLTYSSRITLSSHLRFLEENPATFKVIVDIIQQRHIVTLRLLEHLITNYAKNYSVVLENNFILKHQYKRHLPKKNIDPNRRGPRIKLNHLGEEVVTTIPQLTCLRWVTTSPILAYAEKHAEIIKKDVNVRKGLIPLKKDTSHIQIPICSHPHYLCNVSFFQGYESKDVDSD